MTNEPRHLIVFAGLPGTGKTTLSRRLALRIGAAHLRIDTIEQALAASSLALARPEDAGYSVALAIADDLLVLGQSVIADAVNPVEEARSAWASLSTKRAVPMLFVEIVCSDVAVHQQRLLARGTGPSWSAIEAMGYQEFIRPCLRVDTGRGSIDDAEVMLQSGLERVFGQ